MNIFHFASRCSLLTVSLSLLPSRFQRSVFYTLSYFGSHAWHLRWFTISPDRITSVPDRGDPDVHRMRYPRFKAIEIDESRLIINIVHPVEGKRNFTLMAPSKPIFDKVVEKFEVRNNTNRSNDCFDWNLLKYETTCLLFYYEYVVGLHATQL
jgi:hypothetical protein